MSKQVKVEDKINFSIFEHQKMSCGGYNNCRECAGGSASLHEVTYGLETKFTRLTTTYTKSNEYTPFGHVGLQKESKTDCSRYRVFGHTTRASAQAALSSLKGILAKTQDQRLANYFERCKKAGAACADPFLSSLVDFLKNLKKVVVHFRAEEYGEKCNAATYSVSKSEMQEYAALKEMISYRYDKQTHGSRYVRDMAHVFSFGGAGFLGAAYAMAYLYADMGGTTSAVASAARSAFVSNPAVYGTFLALLTVCIVIAIVLHVKAKQRLAPDKIKYALPKSVTVWQKKRAQAKAGQAAKVEV